MNLTAQTLLKKAISARINAETKLVSARHRADKKAARIQALRAKADELEAMHGADITALEQQYSAALAAETDAREAYEAEIGK